MTLGRPKKYEDKSGAKAYYVTDSFDKHLESLAKDLNTSKSNILMTATYASDPEILKKLVIDRNNLQKKIRELESKVKDTSDAFGVQIIEVPYLEEFLQKFVNTRKKFLEDGLVDYKVVYEIFVSKLAQQDKMLTPQQAQMAKLKIKDWIGRQIKN